VTPILTLSKRLQKLLSFYEDEESIVDIGCDHGLLGLSFINNPLIQSIHLVDQSGDVINDLNKKAKDAYITRKLLLKIQKKNGQELVLGTEKKCIFITGMGGKEIMDILVHLASQLSSIDRVIISPHRNILELREYLFHSEFGLIDEVCIKENGQFYQILCLQKSFVLPNIPIYGEKLWHDQVGKEYLNHLIRALKCHQDATTRAYLDYLVQLSC